MFLLLSLDYQYSIYKVIPRNYGHGQKQLPGNSSSFRHRSEMSKDRGLGNLWYTLMHRILGNLKLNVLTGEHLTITYILTGKVVGKE